MSRREDDEIEQAHRDLLARELAAEARHLNGTEVVLLRKALLSASKALELANVKSMSWAGGRAVIDARGDVETALRIVGPAVTPGHRCPDGTP